LTLYTNGKIITMEKDGIIYKNMIVQNGIIIDVGNDEILKNELYSNFKVNEVINLNGMIVLPGFFDSHLHLISTFLHEIAINFEHAKSISDVLEIISSYPKKYDAPVVLGKRLSEFNLKERRLPTRKELDTVAKDFPIIISSIEFHTVLMNSYAINLFNIPFTTDGFEKDASNNFTGIIKNRGAFLALKKAYELLDEETHLRGSTETFNRAIQHGVTTMVTVEGGPLFHTKHPEILLNNKKNFPIDVELLYSTTDLKKVLKFGLPRVGGDLFLDGSFRSQNAAMFTPYKDSIDNIGTLFFTDKELVEFIGHAHDLDLQVSIHAVGPRAIDVLLDAYEVVLKNKPLSDHRHRIEHFELPLPIHIKRAKELNLVLAMHPTYELFFREGGKMYDTRLDTVRASMTNPFRAIIDEGIKIAGCSDSDVMPIHPMLGIHAAVNHPNKNSRITPYEALEMFTINGAYGIFKEKEKGSLTPGKIADFIVLDNNPLDIEPSKIKDIKVLYTYKNGHLIYRDNRYD